MHGVTELSWRSALLTGWIVGLAASAIAQPPTSPGDPPTRVALLLEKLHLRSAARVPAAEPLDARVAQLEEQLARAYFSEVTEAVRELRASASVEASPPDVQARFEMLAGTAHLARGEASPAVECFKRAMEAWPELELARRTTSPKVLRAFAAARHQILSARVREASTGASGTELPARLIEGPAPVAPPDASDALRPTILCRLLIDASGAVVGATVQRPRRDLARFEEIALATVRSYRFEPARQDGQPVSSWLNWPVRF